jgi:O-antigen/teichoic acid export membrane protein
LASETPCRTLSQQTPLNLIPAFIQRRIAHRPNLFKIVDNIGWLFFDKILRMGVGLLVGVWVARYLGPEQFGLLSFATAFTGLFGAIAALGLQGIVVRDIVRDPDTAKVTLGTAAVLQFIGGLVAYLLILGAIAYMRPDDALARTIVAILGSMMLLKVSDIALFWFESQVQSKYAVWVQNSVFLLFALVKVALILQESALLAFAWATLAEAVVVASLLLLVMDQRGHVLRQLEVSAERAKTLLKDSWPLILSSIAITIYMKIDQIMLGQMLGDESVGIYSAATRISEVWYFIPMAIVASVFPAILESKKLNEEQFTNRVQSLYDTLAVISLAVALPMTFISGWLINLLFGLAYSEAGLVLAIHIWGGLFVSMGLARGKWLLAENLQYMGYWYVGLGMLVNIVGNYFLIPVWGAQGAALTTVFSQATVAIIAPALFGKTRVSALMLLRSIHPFRLVYSFRLALSFAKGLRHP